MLHKETWQNQYNEIGKIKFDEVSGLSSMQLRIILIMNTFAMTDDGFKLDGVTKYFYKIWPLLANIHLCRYSSEY